MSIELRFNEMIGNVLDDYGNEINSDNEYNIASNKYNKVFNKLKENLSYEDKKLLNELDEAASYVEAISTELTYKKGLKDGVELKGILKIVS
ncbi:hypothetical protein P9J83_15670 [Clostridium sporogenes]|uniref:Uncharacterized protein n=1 Tax=Clostridium sporogenes TaxID=1509 RepID=A0AAE4FNM2_CLOSG|nr:DUF6809 family protein [Clostridium sporogenes]MDS1004922.1 hypothetical protein [Clostridium sporogenes]